jgi:hypothetical protein
MFKFNRDEYRYAIGDMLLTPQSLPMLVVYDNPTDFPGKIVLRRSTVYMSPAEGSTVVVSPEQVTFDTLDEARHWIRQTYPHLTVLSRHPGDEPQIVETWL